MSCAHAAKMHTRLAPSSPLLSAPHPPSDPYPFRSLQERFLSDSDKYKAWFSAAIEDDAEFIQTVAAEDPTMLALLLDKRGVAREYEQRDVDFNAHNDQFITYYYNTYFNEQVVDATEYRGINVYARAASKASWRRGFTALEYAALMLNDATVIALLRAGATDYERIKELSPESANFVQMMQRSLAEEHDAAAAAAAKK